VGENPRRNFPTPIAGNSRGLRKRSPFGKAPGTAQPAAWERRAQAGTLEPGAGRRAPGGLGSSERILGAAGRESLTCHSRQVPEVLDDVPQAPGARPYVTGTLRQSDRGECIYDRIVTQISRVYLSGD